MNRMQGVSVKFFSGGRKMKRSLAIIISLIFVMSALFIFSTCGGGGTPKPPGGGYEETVDLGGGVTFTVKSPVPISCNENPSGFNDGWSKVGEVSVSGALPAGKTITVTYESQGGFEAEDKIAYVDGDGNWIPVDSNIRQVGNTISSSVDQCNTVFGAGPVYTLDVTVNYTGSETLDEDHPIYVGAFSVNWLGEARASDPITFSGQGYTFELPAEDYVIYIFLDKNSNDEPDAGDMYQYYDGSGDYAGCTTITLDSNQAVIVNLDDSFTVAASGTVSIAYPNNQTLSSDFTANGTYSGDVNEIRVSIDASEVGTAVLNAASETWSFDVSTSGLGDGSHTISVAAYYNSTLLNSDAASFTFSSTPVNTDPVLSSVTPLFPPDGNTLTTFTYRVTYFDDDGDSPASVQVFIDDEPGVDMYGLGGSSTPGGPYEEIYEYSITLDEGFHTYYFTCSDGNGGSDRLPGGTDTWPGPNVTAVVVNDDPVLTSGSVSDDSGDTSKTFTYSVEYEDSDGHAPSSIEVVIDSAGYLMVEVSSSPGPPFTGSYQYSTTLPEGNYNYYFRCTDGHGGSDRLPDDPDVYSGPTVTGTPTQVTATFTFIDYFSGDLINGVEWYDYESNQILTSGAGDFDEGSMSISGESPLRMRGYFVSVPAGYVLEDVYYVDAFLTEDLSRTIPIEPDEANLPPVMDISGTLNAKGGGTILSGSIAIFTDDGREIGGGYATGMGNYAGGVMTTGDLYFVVDDYDTGENYYTIFNVSGSGTYNIGPPVVGDITLEGSAPAGTEVGAYLLLGEEFVELGSQDVQAGSFSFDIPLQGSDVIRLDCFFEDADGNDWTYYDPTEYTASVSGIDYTTVFSGVLVPSTWTSNLAWDDVNAILTWDSADDISFDVSCYEIEFVSTNLEVVLNAIIEDTGVGNQIETPFGSGELFMASILPVYSEGYIEGFMPAQKAEGVVVWCDDIADRLQTDNDLNFVYFDDSDALPNNLVMSIEIDDQINGMVLVGTNGGGVSYSEDLSTWEQLTTTDGLSSNSVRDIAVDPYLNGYWIGSYGGVDFVDADTGAVLGSLTTSTYPDLVSDNVYCVAVDGSNGGLWIGTQDGVSFFDYQTAEITNYTNTSTGGGLADDWVNDIEVDPWDGGVWFCTNGGVSYYDGAWTTYTTADGLAYNGVEEMAFDDRGGIWFATRLGVSYRDYTGTFTTYRTQDGLWNNFVGCVTIDDEGGVWFGTGSDAATGGVSYYDEEYDFVSFAGDNGLASGYVLSIAIDPDGGLWIGVYGGGVCYLP
jgi:hypothetical protein